MYERDVARQNSSQLLEYINDGLLGVHQVVNMCISWMSESDVSEMMRFNEIPLADEVNEFEEE